MTAHLLTPAVLRQLADLLEAHPALAVTFLTEVAGLVRLTVVTEGFRTVTVESPDALGLLESIAAIVAKESTR